MFSGGHDILLPARLVRPWGDVWLYDVISYSTGCGLSKDGAAVVSSREHDDLFPD